MPRGEGAPPFGGAPLGVALLARAHRDGLALEVDVGLAADVDRHAVDGAAGELPRLAAGVVAGDRVRAVAPDAQPLAGDGELARLGPDAALAHLHVAVEEGQDAGRDPRRVLAVLLEGRGEDDPV